MKSEAMARWIFILFPLCGVLYAEGKRSFLFIFFLNRAFLLYWNIATGTKLCAPPLQRASSPQSSAASAAGFAAWNAPPAWPFPKSPVTSTAGKPGFSLELDPFHQGLQNIRTTLNCGNAVCFSIYLNLRWQCR